MILHIASFRWKSEITEEDVTQLTAALQAMAAEIPQLTSYIAGPNLHLRAGGADYGVAAVLAEAADLDAYLDHPAHLAVYENHLGRMIAERSAVQLPLEQGLLR